MACNAHSAQNPVKLLATRAMQRCFQYTMTGPLAGKALLARRQRALNKIDCVTMYQCG